MTDIRVDSRIFRVGGQNGTFIFVLFLFDREAGVRCRVGAQNELPVFRSAEHSSFPSICLAMRPPQDLPS